MNLFDVEYGLQHYTPREWYIKELDYKKAFDLISEDEYDACMLELTNGESDE